MRDDAESKKLQAFSAHLQELENALPIDPKYRNPKLGALAPIRVVNVVFAAGDGNRGVQTAAFNLPNDERVVHEKGTKRVMLKNMQDAKFKMVLLPIAKVALPAAEQKNVSFDAFFTHILMHELMHGLGPHNITVGGRADDGAAGAEGDLQRDRGSQGRRLGPVGAAAARRHRARSTPAIARTMYTTFLASAFRSIRFGVNEAHGRGIAIQLNYLLDAGAFKVQRRTARFTVDDAKIGRRGHGADARDHDAAGRRQLREGQGDDRRSSASSGREVQKVLDRLTAVPVDIEPRFTSAAVMSRGGSRVRGSRTSGPADSYRSQQYLHRETLVSRAKDIPRTSRRSLLTP